MAVATIDIPYLSTYCSLPQATLITLRDAPTVELVNTLLVQVAAKAREFDEVKAENAVRSGESKARVLKSSFDKGLKEAADLRDKLKAEGEHFLQVTRHESFNADQMCNQRTPD